MSLDQWRQWGWVQTHETSAFEIQRLLQVVDRDLADASVGGVSKDGRFQHAYDAALQLCMIPLHARGFRVKKGEGHHKKGIDSLKLTLGAQYAATADHLERCSRLRSQSVYERIGVVSEEDVAELLAAARDLRRDVVTWLQSNHPELLQSGE